MKLRKIFRFRLRPNSYEEKSLARMSGARRFVWNWALAECQIPTPWSRSYYGGTVGSESKSVLCTYIEA